MHKNYFEVGGIHLTFDLRGKKPKWNKQNNKQGWQWLVKDECDERDDKRDEREIFGLTFHVLYSSYI